VVHYIILPGLVSIALRSNASIEAHDSVLDHAASGFFLFRRSKIAVLFRRMGLIMGHRRTVVESSFWLLALYKLRHSIARASSTLINGSKF
jgi:hypothetical protein